MRSDYDVNEIWTRFERDLNEIWARFERDLNEIWTKLEIEVTTEVIEDITEDTIIADTTQYRSKVPEDCQWFFVTLRFERDLNEIWTRFERDLN